MGASEPGIVPAKTQRRVRTSPATFPSVVPDTPKAQPPLRLQRILEASMWFLYPFSSQLPKPATAPLETSLSFYSLSTLLMLPEETESLPEAKPGQLLSQLTSVPRMGLVTAVISTTPSAVARESSVLPHHHHHQNPPFHTSTRPEHPQTTEPERKHLPPAAARGILSQPGGDSWETLGLPR